MNNGIILLVEDNPGDEALTLRALQRNNIGNKVIVIKDGEEALDFFFCRNHYANRDPYEMPQLTLLDMKLPKMDGLDVLRCLRADDRTRLLPIVIFSSSSEQKDVTGSYQCGANSYIQKSVNCAEFMETVS